MYFNQAVVIGNLTRDPELKSLPSGIKVATFTIATNRTWKNPQGEKETATDYHNVVAFGNQGETIARFMKKGNIMMISGRMQTRSWDGPDGTKRYRTEIVTDGFQFGPRSGVGSNTEYGGVTGPSSFSKNDDGVDMGGSMDDFGPIDYPQDNNNLEDIPF
jgi:single-strand DNA-binding protein